MNDQQPQIRKPLAPPSHIRYAHGLGRGMLTLEQIDELVKPINPAYVMKKQGSNTYLSQHQARAEMNRIFGYGNWSSRVLSMDLEYEERMHKDDSPRHPNFPRNGKAEIYWISCYKAQVEVEIRDLWGMPVATFSEFHIEENAPQPNRGEARALAATSVESYALRRALIGLGDRLGLGLYNGGSTAPHGQYTIQQYPGQLFEWALPEAAPQQAPAPVAVVTHETIQAEKAVADDVEPTRYEEQPAPQQQQQQQVPQQQGIQQSPQMQQFHQVQQQLQQDREQARQQPMSPEMQARLQQGLKVDGAQG